MSDNTMDFPPNPNNTSIESGIGDTFSEDKDTNEEIVVVDEVPRGTVKYKDYEESMLTQEDGNKEPPQVPLPRPVIMRINLLFAGSIACLVVGGIASSIFNDRMLLFLALIVAVGTATKAYLLRRKVLIGGIYSVSGVCISITPRIMRRYMKNTLVDVQTDEEFHIILPKKTVFKVGHSYTCYFDTPINAKNPTVATTPNATANAWLEDMDLPTNGFIGYEDFGIYREAPVTTSKSGEVANDMDGEVSQSSEEPEGNHNS